MLRVHQLARLLYTRTNPKQSEPKPGEQSQFFALPLWFHLVHLHQLCKGFLLARGVEKPCKCDFTSWNLMYFPVPGKGVTGWARRGAWHPWCHNLHLGNLHNRFASANSQSQEMSKSHQPDQKLLSLLHQLQLQKSVYLSNTSHALMHQSLHLTNIPAPPTRQSVACLCFVSA